MRAPGATPSRSPTLTPLTVALKTWSPAAVLAVCEPWPSKSRGDRYSPGLLPDRPAESKNCAPMTLLLQWTGGPETPGSQEPLHLDAMIASSERGDGSAAKLGLSGQKPVSMSATMTPLPALLSLPNCWRHTPLL